MVRQTVERIGAAAILVAVVFSPAVAMAEDAESLATRANELRRQGRDRDALPLFQEALKQRSTPKLVTQLGLCEQAIGLWVGAEAHLQQALTQTGDPWIQKNETVIREALSFVRQKVGDLELWGTPDGANVSVDNVAVATLPMAAPVRLPIGRRTVTITAPGFVEETRTVDISPGARMREHVVLVKRPQLSATEPKGDSAPVVHVGSGPDQPPPPPAEDSPSGPIYTRWWFWTAVGAVVVAGGVSAYLIFGRDNNCNAAMGATCGKW